MLLFEERIFINNLLCLFYPQPREALKRAGKYQSPPDDGRGRDKSGENSGVG